MSNTTENRPRPEDYAFDLQAVFASVVSLRCHIPEDAFTASVLGTERSGNGVVIRPDGLILTIGYLVTEAETVWITDHLGRATQGHVLAYDQETGFGLVQPLGRLDLPALEIGRSAGVREGDPVLVVGFGGLDASVRAEVIAVREFAGYWEYLLDEAIFTAPAHPNWGGSAVVGRNGELLGIGSLFIQQTGGGRGTTDGNMIVPIDLLPPILDEMLKLGRADRKPRPWLGMFGAEAEDKVVVAALSDDGPADQAGIQVGDIILAVAGKPVHSLAELFRHCWRVGPAGVSIPVIVERESEIVEIDIESIARSDMLKGPRLH